MMALAPAADGSFHLTNGDLIEEAAELATWKRARWSRCRCRSPPGFSR